MRMIGICGRAGSGKSFLAQELRDLEPKVVKVSFAAQLRHEIETQLGVEPGATKLWDKPTSPALRFILQQYGTNYRRAQDPDYWVKKGMAVANMYDQEGRLVVFHDVRFPNEAYAIKNAGGLIVRVATHVHLRKERLGELPPDHASETALDDFEFDFYLEGRQSDEHSKTVRDILTEATFNDVDFMEAINESLTHRE